MAQINLLKQNTSSASRFVGHIPGILFKIFLLVFFGLVGFYVWVFVQTSSLEKEIVNKTKETELRKSQAAQVPSRDELGTRQGQLEELNRILGQQKFWSNLLPILGQVTLKSAKYSNISATPDGSLTLSGNVRDLTDLDKYFLVFDQPKVYKNFWDLKISNFQQQEDKDGNKKIIFGIQLKFDPAILSNKN